MSEPTTAPTGTEPGHPTAFEPPVPRPAVPELPAFRRSRVRLGGMLVVMGILHFAVPGPFIKIAAGGTEFWDVHATLDAEHGDWTVDALAAAGADPAEVQTAARQGADAWLAFLDEREAAAGVAAG